MSNPQFDFEDESRWFLLADQLYLAQPVTGDPRLFNPISAIDINDIADYPFIRIFAGNDTARSWWRLGCYLDFLVDEINPRVRLLRVFCPLNEPLIVEAPTTVASYRLRVHVPFWFEQFKLFLYGYIL